MQAVILVGGEGTRLRPLTSTVPKPIVPLVDRPFLGYMLEWLKSHGVEDVVLSMGYLGEFLVQAGGVGSIRRFRARFAKLTWPGDVVTCRGRVTAVRDEGAARLVDCDIWTENQEGERKLVGAALLALTRPEA